jgi:fructokinase
LFLDVNLRDPWVDAGTLRWSLRRASVVKLNEEELVRIADLLSLDGATPRACAAVLIAGFGLQGAGGDPGCRRRLDARHRLRTGLLS